MPFDNQKPPFLPFEVYGRKLYNTLTAEVLCTESSGLFQRRLELAFKDGRRD